MSTVHGSTDLTDLLPERRKDVFESVLDFLYEWPITVLAETLAPLSKAAHILQIHELQTKVEMTVPTLATLSDASVRWEYRRRDQK